MTENDRWGQFSNLGFGLCLPDIFPAILNGAALVPIASPGEKLFPGKMIKRHGITFWNSVPSVVDLMDKAGHLTPAYLETLRKISFCGERLFPTRVEKLLAVNPDLIIYNTYGPTEITIFCTAKKIDIHTYKNYSHKTMSIGKPMPG